MTDDAQVDFLTVVRGDVATRAFFTVLKRLDGVIRLHFPDRAHVQIVDATHGQQVFTPYLEHVPGTTLVRMTAAAGDQPDSVVLVLEADLGAARTLDVAVVMPSLRRHVQLVADVTAECKQRAAEWRQPGGVFDEIARHANAMVYRDVPPVTVDLITKVAKVTQAGDEQPEQARAKRPASPSAEEPPAKRRAWPPRVEVPSPKLDLRVQSKQPPPTHAFDSVDPDIDVRVPKVILRDLKTGELGRFVNADMWVRMCATVASDAGMLRWLADQDIASVTLADATKIFAELAKTWPRETAQVAERCKFIPVSRAPSLLVAYHAFTKCHTA
jgi:hypothetical protein